MIKNGAGETVPGVVYTCDVKEFFEEVEDYNQVIRINYRCTWVPLIACPGNVRLVGVSRVAGPPDQHGPVHVFDSEFPGESGSIGISMPAFWLALMLMLLFSLKLGWLPAQGAKDGWKSYVLPSIAIGFMQMAAIARTTRSSMLETIRQDYIRTARSKGITEREVIFHHSFRNALIPTVTIVGVQLGGLLGGAVLTETVFAWPGLGRLVVQAVNGRDVPVVLGCIVVLSVGFSIVNLVVDLLYGFIDPRVRSMYQ